MCIRDRVRGVEPGRHGPDCDGGEVGDHPFGSVLGVDGDDISALDTEGEKSVRCGDDFIPELRPGALLPDSEVLVTHRDGVGSCECPLTNHERDSTVCTGAVSYTHLRAHETVLDLVCRL